MDYDEGCHTIVVVSYFLFAFIFVFIVLPLFAIFQPSDLKFYVTEASLSHFDLTNSNIMYSNISFNFTVNISVTNPNRFTRVDFRSIKAMASYKERELSCVRLTPFVLEGHKNTMMSFMETEAFEGERVVDRLQPCQEADYNYEVKAGIYDMVVDLDLRVVASYPYSSADLFRPPVVRCGFRVPLVSDGGESSAVPFNVTKCTIEGYFFDERRDPAPPRQNRFKYDG